MQFKFFSPFFIVSIFILDRLTKVLIQQKLFLGESIPVLPFFHLTHLENTGIAFGLGQGWNHFFIGSTIVILILLLVLRRKWERAEPENLKLKTALALVIGGALGNLYDRIVYGRVTDFLDFFIGSHHWPAFNIADSAICVGTFLLISSQLKKKVL